MIKVENVSLQQIRDFGIVLLALLALVVLIGNVVKTIQGWKKPHDDLEKWRRDVDTKLANDNTRLAALERGNNVVCRAMLALISHSINGNSKDKLEASQTELMNYLIDR